MNSLSWFLYAIDVLTSLGVALELLTLFSVGGFIAVLLVYSLSIDGAYTSEETDRLRKDKPKWARRLGIMAIVVGFLTCFVPSKNTLYAIAASEVGERLAKTPEVKGLASDALRALRLWIGKQAYGKPEKK